MKKEKKKKRRRKTQTQTQKHAVDPNTHVVYIGVFVNSLFQIC